mmetsp:Transcript_26464/g.68253  ORF Transcript_26464/g.68253 Transcript_26464/m.68253 type:complete len:233 (-) Transcript_26464:256-954(-)
MQDVHGGGGAGACLKRVGQGSLIAAELRQVCNAHQHLCPSVVSLQGQPLLPIVAWLGHIQVSVHLHIAQAVVWGLHVHIKHLQLQPICARDQTARPDAKAGLTGRANRGAGSTTAAAVLLSKTRGTAAALGKTGGNAVTLLGNTGGRARSCRRGGCRSAGGCWCAGGRLSLLLLIHLQQLCHTSLRLWGLRHSQGEQRSKVPSGILAADCDWGHLLCAAKGQAAVGAPVRAG